MFEKYKKVYKADYENGIKKMKLTDNVWQQIKID